MPKRYLRQDGIVPDISRSSFLIVGCGGLGSSTAELLARMGAGKLHLVDEDKVELTNLHRVSLFNEGDIGKNKAETLKRRLKGINSKATITVTPKALKSSNIKHLKECDIVLDCTDNLETRFLINAFCSQHRIPWVHASVAEDQAFVKSFTESPCYKCYVQSFQEKKRKINPAVVRIASGLQASEAVKVIQGQGTKELIYFNIRKLSFKLIKIKPHSSCPICRRYPNQ